MKLDSKVWDGIFYDGPPPSSTRTRPILGFRMHRVADGGLVSLSNPDYVWKPGKNVAECRFYPGKHHAPGPACRCGFHAFHDLNSLMQHLGEWGSFLRSGQRLILVGVAATGIVRIHELGWRAQYARILALSDEIPALAFSYVGGKIVGRFEPTRAAPARLVAKLYQVPVVPLSDLLDVMHAVGDLKEEVRWS